MSVTKINTRNYLRKNSSNKLLPVYDQILNDILSEIDSSIVNLETTTAGIGADSLTPLEVNALVTDSISATLGGDGLQIDGLYIKDNGFYQYRKPKIKLTTEDTYLLGNNLSNYMFLLNKATGIEITMSGATSNNTIGSEFEVIVLTSVSSNVYSFTVADTNNDSFIGSITYVDTGSSNAETRVIASGTILSMNGSTTGGLQSTHLKFKVADNNKWLVEGTIIGNGSVGAIFS